LLCRALLVAVTPGFASARDTTSVPSSKASSTSYSDACKVLKFIDVYDSVKVLQRIISDTDSPAEKSVFPALAAIGTLFCPDPTVENAAKKLGTSLENAFGLSKPSAIRLALGTPAVSSFPPSGLAASWLQVAPFATGTEIPVVMEWRYRNQPTTWRGRTTLYYPSGIREDSATYYSGVSSPCLGVVVAIWTASTGWEVGQSYQPTDC
jgi:hypothetical protein